jgi:SAM-dependent methyltransferase
MSHNDTSTLYDTDDYYAGGDGARLAPVLEPLIGWLDGQRARNLLLQLRPPSDRPPRVLDVGAGTGGVLARLRDRGVEVYGTTASRTARDAAERRHGLALEVATEIPTALAALPFDVITYWHVFEHLDDPAAHVAAWPAMLAEGGFVLVEVPNIDSVGARICKRSWLGSDPVHHVNMLSRTEIAALLARYGLRIEKSTGFSLKFTYVFLWSALLGLLFGRAYDFDSVFDVLKRPLVSLRRRPLRTLNAVVAVFYLAPAIAVLAAWGVLTDRGEVLRLEITRGSPKPDDPHPALTKRRHTDDSTCQSVV